MENKTKRTLLQRYGIPIHHLDFQYIKDCKDAKEMEKIVYILRSNEEGYFPDLTKCAEEKLKELKPHSRLFRLEEPIKGREALEPNELKPIYDWNEDIKSTDKKLQKLLKEDKYQNLKDPQMPPIRKSGSILQIRNVSEKSTNSNTNNKTETSTCKRIKSTDYNKWDKFDPEEEILRLDLAEERQQEEVERKNHLNTQKLVKQPLTITEVKEEEGDSKPLDKWLNLTDIEKERISEEYRLRGNEYFRSKEYDFALKEYSSAIQCCPEKAVAAYNNRALTYFKQQQYFYSIKDCEACLKIEPDNLKARLRLAEGNYAYGRRRESYQLYLNVLKLDPKNAVALKATTELRKQFEDLPPPNATRLQIQDESNKNKKITEQRSQMKPKTKSLNYDLAELIKPNRVVPNKLVKTAESLGKNMFKNENKKPAQETPNAEATNGIELLLLPGHKPTKMGKKLIEEL